MQHKCKSVGGGNLQIYATDETSLFLFNTGLCKTVFLQFLFRSSYRRCSARKSALRIFEKSTEKRPRLNISCNKATGLRPATLLKKRLVHRRFPVNSAKPLRTPSQNTLGRLVLLFAKLVFRLSVLFALNQMFWIQTLKNVVSSYVIFLYNFDR